MTKIFITPHRRYNPLTGGWVLVSPQRTKRPWQGQTEEAQQQKKLPKYDRNCYLCPGNKRAGGNLTPEYEDTFVFTNDFPAIIPQPKTDSPKMHQLLRTDSISGTCRVVCFSPSHDLTLANMQTNEIQKVVDVWAAQTEELGRDYAWVQVFENRGAAMGCSNPHPHGQIWAETSLPNEAQKEDRTQKAYLRQNNKLLLQEYAKLEIEQQKRIVAINNDWLVVVPFWAVWPFEALLMPKKRHITRIPELTSKERASLADIMKDLLMRYDKLFNVSFPYSMGWHGAPYIDGNISHWQLHAHYFPPLLRSAAIKKFMVGYEMLSEPQRDITPEQAAEMLRKL